MKKGLIIIVGVLLLCSPGWAVTPLALKEKLQNKEAITLIDIRGTSFYQKGHIPGAINIPAAVLSKKRLSQFASIIIYGDGIRTDKTLQAAEEVNRIQGILVKILEGGFAAWQSLHLNTTLAKGISANQFHYLTYNDLARLARSDKNIVLVDLRKRATPLTDLAETFPGLTALRTRGGAIHRGGLRHDTKKIETSRGMRHQQLYVLIDDGNGESEKLAHHLHASGVGRLAILAGGERALERKGLPEQTTTRSVGTIN